MFMFDGLDVGRTGRSAEEEDEDEEEEEEEGFIPWVGQTGSAQEGEFDQFGGVEESQLPIAPAPKMPEEYYSGLENFLSRSPPRLKSKKRQEVESAATIIGRSVPPSKQTASSSTGRASQGMAAAPRPFDPNLLREAFAYTDKLLRESVMEEAQEAAAAARQQNKQQQQQHSKKRDGGGAPPKPRSAGSMEKSMSAYGQNPKSAPAGGGKGGSAKERLGAGLVKRLRDSAGNASHVTSAAALLAGAGTGRQQQQRSDSGAFSVSAVSEDDSASRKIVDVDAMVRNFQDGVTLKKLQAELAASQQSMKRSENAFRELAGRAGLR